jgi:protein CsiD
MSILTTENGSMKFIRQTDTYEIQQHPKQKRLYHIQFNQEVLEKFFKSSEDVNVQQLEYVPFMRFILSSKLEELVGSEFGEILRALVHDRESGGFTVGVQGITQNDQEYVKFSTAISHLLGPANFDAMSGTFFARFTVKDTDSSDSYLRQAYRRFTLHTDGTFVDDATDWLLMMKFEERNAVGGESRILHLDDWEDLEKFSTDPMATHEFTYKSPPSKNVQQVIKRQTFFQVNGKPCICFIDQFAYPETIKEAQYLQNLSDSMESSPAVHELELPEGDLIVLNNLFWLHGRAAFEKHEELYRELLRQRGSFSKI